MKGNRVKLRRWQGVPRNGNHNDRPSVYLGRCSDSQYHAFAAHLRELQQARSFHRSPAPTTEAWLAGLSDGFHARIVKAGLCDSRRKEAALPEPTLAVYVAGYIDRRGDLRPSTILNLRQAQSKLLEFFGEAKLMKDITVGDAKAFRRDLVKQGYQSATIAMHIKKGRQFFADAIDHEKLSKNPFAKVEIGSQVNVGRMQYVDVAAVEQVIEKATDAKWKAIIGLCRYAALRCPSELQGLRFSDLKPDRLRVTSPKTEDQGKAERMVPVSRRLRELLMALHLTAGAEAVKMFAAMEGSKNLRTEMSRFCEEAGVERWPKLFQNLRLSCETDWMDTDGIALACKWAGNSPTVALKHYHLVRNTDYVRAATRGAESGAASGERQGTVRESEGSKIPAVAQLLDVRNIPMPPPGVESPRFSAEINDSGGAVVHDPVHVTGYTIIRLGSQSKAIDDRGKPLRAPRGTSARAVVKVRHALAVMFMRERQVRKSQLSTVDSANFRQTVKGGR